jgi:GNAT superfamily N-acetyltransferase
VRRIDIRGVLPADFAKLGQIFGTFLGHAYAERSRLPGAVLVAEAQSHLLAAVFVSTGTPTENEIVERLGDVPMLHRLIVAAEHRRQLIGTRMIAAAETMLRDAGHSLLAVGVDLGNDGAARLYRRLGYTEWPHGVLKTFREHGDENGNVIVTPDECRVFVKDLSTEEAA